MSMIHREHDRLDWKISGLISLISWNKAYNQIDKRASQRQGRSAGESYCNGTDRRVTLKKPVRG
jgi:hypothetical protein